MIETSPWPWSQRASMSAALIPRRSSTLTAVALDRNASASTLRSATPTGEGSSRSALVPSGGASTYGVGAIGRRPFAESPYAEDLGSPSPALPDRVPSSRAATAVAAPMLAALAPASFLLFTCCPLVSVLVDDHERSQWNLDQLVQRV